MSADSHDGQVKQFKLDETQSQKLTGWKKEPSILDLKRDMEAARPSHDAQYAKIEHWNDLMAIKGSAKIEKVKGRSSVQPKLIRRQAEWRYSALTEPFLGSDKLFKIKPVTFEDEFAAKQNELVLNWQFRTKIDRVRFIDDYIRATVDEGTSVIRVGWKRTTVKVKKTVPVFSLYEIETQEQADAFKEALAARTDNPREFNDKADPAIKEALAHFDETEQVTYAVESGTEEITVEEVIENRPTIDILDFRNVFIDPSCGGDIENALFVGTSFETNKAELLKEGKRYKNLNKVNWEGHSPLTEPHHATKTPDNFQFADVARRKVVAYEYWGFFDIEGNGVLKPFVATWIGDILIRMELNPYPDGKLPFVVTRYLPVKRELYGEPDAELLEDNQKILGAVTRGLIDLLGKSANGQQGHAKGMLDPMNRRKFDRGDDYEFNPTIHPANGMIEHKYPELPQSALTMMGLQNQDAESLTGVKSFSGGVSGEAYGDVAAGIRGVLDASSKREMAILRRFAKGMADVGNKFITMNAEFMSEEETVRVTNEVFVKVKREDLKGNFDLIADISTAEADNAKAQDMGMMLQTIGPSADPSITMLIMADIADLKRMPGLAHKLRTFKPTPDPIVEELKKLEVQAKQKEIEKLDSEINLNNAKAAQVSSMKDKLDLDFVEQESGTNHARDMEKQQGQSRGNQSLEVTKALTKPVKEGEKRGDVEAAIGFNELNDKLQGLDAPVSAPMPPAPVPEPIYA